MWDQAVADARSAEAAQVTWLRENMQSHFTRKLLRIVRDIDKFIAPQDGDPSHAFPQLAGSHLSEVCIVLYQRLSPQLVGANEAIIFSEFIIPLKIILVEIKFTPMLPIICICPSGGAGNARASIY